MNLEVEVEKSFREFSLDVSFCLHSERTGIFGPSGSGKSTIMSMLSGLGQPDRGRICLGDKVLFDSKKKINLKPEQRGIGIVFQHAHLFPHMSVKRNLLYGYKRIKPEKRRVDPEALFSILDIDALMQRNVMTLSGGERQRIALARTVLSCPDLIMMDEPLSALDEGHKFQIIPYLNTVFAKFSIPLLFISHSMLEMRMMTDEVLVIEKGKLVQQSLTEDLGKTVWHEGQTDGYVNLIKLGVAESYHGLYHYPWGDGMLVLNEPASDNENLFELNSRDILLFKRHPEATSARNLLLCHVKEIRREGNLCRVELSCGDKSLIAEIVPESLHELGLEKGREVVAAFKATAFKKLF